VWFKQGNLLQAPQVRVRGKDHTASYLLSLKTSNYYSQIGEPAETEGVSRIERLLEGSLQFSEGDVEGLRENPAFSDDTHEVGVPDPTRYNVKMQVVLHACPGAFTEVHSQIKSVRMIIAFDGELALCGKIHHLGELSCRAIQEIGQMRVRTYQQVSGRIGKYIEDNEIMLPAKEDELFIVMLYRFANAKHASVGVLDIGDVLISPWTPQIIHAKRDC
jgi:hypothetical protein